MTECMSVSHSKTSNECIGLSAGYVNGRCPKRNGYVYSETIQSCFKIHVKDTSLQSAEYDSKCGLEEAELMRIDSEEKQIILMLPVG
ncbi:unnamed protein product [Mytilus edulis]|uniref:Uncharacterized protein n=1 Tax=Mytilus edulis TaxID=6550 RepID=A0A8S3SPZ8_MYTED|nr:unnamed protein product [Mytilus edulis]